MKAFYTFLLACFFTFPALFAQAAEDKKSEEVNTYPGMEIKKVGDVNVLIPKGSKLRHENDLLVIESTDEYAAPRFIEVDKRLDALEAGQKELEAVDKRLDALEAVQKELKAEVEQLREAVEYQVEATPISDLPQSTE